MNAKQSLAMACAFACSAGLMGAATAQPAGSSPSNPLSAEQALEFDARAVASYRGISPEAARSRMIVQRSARPIAKRIRAQYAHRLAGMYIEHEPRHRLVVRLTGHDAVRPEFHDIEGRALEVAFVVGADRTLVEAQRLFDGKLTALRERVPGIQGGYIDERNGDFVVEFVRNAKADRLDDVERAVAGHFGAPARLLELDAPMANHTVYGSGHLDFEQTVGMVTDDVQCTGAFTVRTIATPRTYGLLTAGHCQSNDTLFDYLEAGGGVTTATLMFQDDKFDANSDIAWLSAGTSAIDVGPNFYANTWRVLNDVITKADTIVGDDMCKYGRATGYGCGEVVSKAYNPGSICGPGITFGSGTSSCSASFVRVEAPAGLCAATDSGGPWFYENDAAGVHKAGTTITVGLNIVNVCAYTSIDDIAAMNVELVF